MNMNDDSTTVSCTATPVAIVKFQLLIDGCNGPIRFRERNLIDIRNDKKRDGGDDSDNAGDEDTTNSTTTTTTDNDNGDNDNDNDNVILSFLRPDSIFEETHNNNNNKKTNSKKSSKQKKKKNNNGNTKSKNEAIDGDPSSNTSRPDNNSYYDPERLDMIPLLDKLLKMKVNNNENKNDDSSSPSSLFHSVSVIFDGISMTKRPSIPSLQPPSSISPEDSGESQQDNNDIEERERIWLIMQNYDHNSAILLPATETGENDNNDNNDSSRNICKSNSAVGTVGTIKIEITGLYDEADNVIVDRILQLQQKQQQQRLRRIRRTSSSSSASRRATQNQNQNQTQIQILHRTEQGPGKNRCLLQSIGLLRPESVACIYDFDFKYNNTTAIPNNPAAAKTDVGIDDVEDTTATTTTCTSTLLFGRLTKDGQKTIKSLQQNRLLPSTGMIDIETTRTTTTSFASSVIINDDKEEDGFEEKKEEEDHITTDQEDTNNEQKNNIIIVPIVVTDDVFLRQRIIEEANYYCYADSANTDNDNYDEDDDKVISNNNRTIKGGYVMTFHQLWHMLMDVKNKTN